MCIRLVDYLEAAETVFRPLIDIAIQSRQRLAEIDEWH